MLKNDMKFEEEEMKAMQSLQRCEKSPQVFR